ncbi:MAG TPA: anaerobic ribonucleoside-triphosphate reductase activating protein [Methanomicrobia archaeon]|nr:anaerobic ribonucleoside-triphosphate reductase activating protein [Methanomicrobia archaeon]
MAAVNLGDIVPVSTIDWRGKTAMVIFLRGCPLNCVYCQNAQIRAGSNYVDLDDLEAEIVKNACVIDAVVLSGGEPCMQPVALEALAAVARKQGLLVAVQTCGYYPDAVESLLHQGLVEKLFLDIKAPLSSGARYDELTRATGVAARVKRTLEVCVHAAVEFEVITTVFKGLVAREEVTAIARELVARGAHAQPYIIQQGRAEVVSGRTLDATAVFSRAELKELAAEALSAAPLHEVRIRTREQGEEVVFKLSSGKKVNERTW